MSQRAVPRRKTPRPRASSFNLKRFLGSAGNDRSIIESAPDDVIYAQGDSADDVFYIQHGEIKLSVASARGKEAILTVLTVGDFFGEACLIGEGRRTASATALSRSTLLMMKKYRCSKWSARTRRSQRACWFTR